MDQAENTINDWARAELRRFGKQVPVDADTEITIAAGWDGDAFVSVWLRGANGFLESGGPSWEADEFRQMLISLVTFTLTQSNGNAVQPAG